jgi:hypothetical protein
MTRNFLFAAAAAAALTMSAQAFAQGAAPSPEAFPPYAADTSSGYWPQNQWHGIYDRVGARVKLHEGRASAFVPSVGTTNTSREGQIQAN